MPDDAPKHLSFRESMKAYGAFNFLQDMKAYGVPWHIRLHVYLMIFIDRAHERLTRPFR